MNTPGEELSITGRQFRMDIPFDQRNKVKWHQEVSYFRNDGLVVWIPLIDVDSESGAPFVCPKSHTEGDILVEKESSDNWETTRQFELKQELIEKYTPIQVPMEKGDVLFFDWRNTPHSTANCGIHNRPFLKITGTVDDDSYIHKSKEKGSIKKIKV